MTTVARNHATGCPESGTGRHGDDFVLRHIGPRPSDYAEMLATIGHPNMEALIDAVLPPSIRLSRPMDVGPGTDEREVLQRLRQIALQNKVFRSYIGMGYSDCQTPPVIQRNVLENPGWYTQYTPYQAEIAQGRLEALLNFQTMISDLTGLEIANASLLDEGTAAAEAMHMSYGLSRHECENYFVSELCHPQTIEVVRTRAWALGINVIVENHEKFSFEKPVFGVLLQYPGTDGRILDYAAFIERAHAAGAIATVAADILSLVLLKAPGEFGADIAVGNTQRFGVPLGYGGPHAAYFATRDAYRRSIPGRLVGVSHDSQGRPALRLSLQTREQHIRREKATSNICTAQVLLAVIAGMYAVYHGPAGLKRIARQVHYRTALLAAGLRRMGYDIGPAPFFDTLRIEAGNGRAAAILEAARARCINLRTLDSDAIGVSLDETTQVSDIACLLEIFSPQGVEPCRMEAIAQGLEGSIDAQFARTSAFLTHPVFNRYHSETEMLRYIHRLQGRDLSLTTSMIALGSCTMKLNAAVEMYPITWPEFSALHPFVPGEQARGYRILFEQLEGWLAEITGFSAVSLQPNAGSQGEYAGLLAIRRYHDAQGDGKRRICLIPQSAHGTNPASAVMAGLTVVVVACDANGNIDVADLRDKAHQHAEGLAALMVTYPSTHGVFEEAIREICEIVHECGGQVYMDGANMNAQVGLCRPADIGADVCHLNLHKTFCIPHGGGGPGMGPIGVKEHLAPYLPGHPAIPAGGSQRAWPVSAAPWGSASILPISWVYIALMGSRGLTEATKVAILNANYVASRLDPHFPVLYKGKNGLVAHECILDLRQLKKSAGIEVEDVAKRLMDYGFHAPTVSFPVAGTLMVEPTESESKEELDRFCDAMINIRREIEAIEAGRMDPRDNPLKNAPHTAESLLAVDWNHPYTRMEAAYPAAYAREHKFWPPSGRVDNVYGDRHLVCTCLPVEDYAK